MDKTISALFAYLRGRKRLSYNVVQLHSLCNTLLWSYKLSYQTVLVVSLVFQGRNGVIRFMICINCLRESALTFNVILTFLTFMGPCLVRIF